MKNIIIITLTLFSTLAFGARPAPEVDPLVLRFDYMKNFNGPSFEGIVKLSNCSGALVTFKGMPKSKLALVMTNGHCIGFTKMGEVITNKPVVRKVSVFNQEMKLNPLQTTRVIYATQTHTDVTFYEVNMNYEQILNLYGVEALTIEDSVTAVGTEIDIISGYWETVTSCRAEAIVPTLKEDIWIWKESVRYSSECKTKGGFSGSPVIAKNTRSIVAIHNTGDNGKFDCSDSNPCELNDAGQITFKVPGRRYAQQVYQAYTCLNDKFDIDLTVPGCELPKP